MDDLKHEHKIVNIIMLANTGMVLISFNNPTRLVVGLCITCGCIGYSLAKVIHWTRTVTAEDLPQWKPKK